MRQDLDKWWDSLQEEHPEIYACTYRNFENFFYEVLYNNRVKISMKSGAFGYEYGSIQGVHDPGPIVEPIWKGSREIDCYLINPAPPYWDNTNEATVDIPRETPRGEYPLILSLKQIQCETVEKMGVQLSHLKGELQ